ncbi:hypothetical protein LOTGIDRAFT_153695 [Lottia gigantea]|uniref:Uncharacterized protein n=1 Tax=Lottia gigantea TaxID=225164 RepID=V4A890_LOTGI|nr:hypothetical protein LOTGIDRAFT_153695 [Lottia gigantea]ESO91265.1 hypothetical protein LOTGIDRAFT_153695 [Lottia gigantea]
MSMIIAQTYFGSDIQKSLGSLPCFPWAKYPGEKHLPGHNYTGPENSLETPSEDNHQKLARINDKAAKCKMKSYADQKFHAKSSDLMQGDLVLVKQNKVDKLSTPFSAEPSLVIDVKGSMITLKRPNGKVYARNSSLLKRVPTTSNQLNKATSDSEDDIEDDSYAQRPNPIIPQPMRRNPRRHRNRPRYLNDYVLGKF